jgi:hypothetical protein
MYRREGVRLGMYASSSSCSLDEEEACITYLFFIFYFSSSSCSLDAVVSLLVAGNIGVYWCISVYIGIHHA